MKTPISRRSVGPTTESTTEQSTTPLTLDYLKTCLSSPLPPAPITNPFFKDIDPLSKDSDGYTPLHHAKTRDECLWLIHNKANINTQTTYEGYTPLLYHLINKRMDCVYILLQSQADVDIMSEDQLSVLHETIHHHNSIIVDLFIYYKCDVNVCNNDSMTPLHYAAQYNQHCIPSLIEAKADILSNDMQGSTPLHIALMNNHIDATRYLLNAKSDINSRDEYGQTPLMLALKDCPSSVPYILDYIQYPNIDIYCCDDDSNTALYYATQHNPQYIPYIIKYYNQQVINMISSSSSLLSSSSSPLLSSSLPSSLSFSTLPLSPLYNAIYNNDIQYIMSYTHSDYNDGNDNNNNNKTTTTTPSIMNILTPLMYALHFNPNMIPLLINNNIDNVNNKNIHGDSVLHYFVYFNSQDLHILLDAKADPSSLDHYNNTPLHIAIYTNSIDSITTLLNYNASIDIHNLCGQTPLMCAAQIAPHLMTDLVHNNINNNIDLNIENPQNKWTALNYLVTHHPQYTNLLLYANADIYHRNIWKFTPFHVVLWNNSMESIWSFLSFGIDVNIKDDSGLTAIGHAIRKDMKDIVTLLIDSRADINIPNKLNTSPLHCAILHSPQYVHMLINHNADIQYCDKEHSTPLHIAITTKNETIIRQLLDAKADVNSINKYGLTPLMVASQKCPTIIPILLEYNPDITLNDPFGPGLFYYTSK